jgi:hypothetical protein
MGSVGMGFWATAKPPTRKMEHNTPRATICFIMAHLIIKSSLLKNEFLVSPNQRKSLLSFQQKRKLLFSVLTSQPHSP